jgi:hypothetical protein
MFQCNLRGKLFQSTFNYLQLKINLKVNYKIKNKLLFILQ